MRNQLILLLCCIIFLSFSCCNIVCKQFSPTSLCYGKQKSVEGQGKNFQHLKHVMSLQIQKTQFIILLTSTISFGFVHYWHSSSLEMMYHEVLSMLPKQKVQLGKKLYVCCQVYYVQTIIGLSTFLLSINYWLEFSTNRSRYFIQLEYTGYIYISSKYK